MTMEPLDPWDQFAMRAYMQVAVCFPFDDNCSKIEASQRKGDVLHHLRAALDTLAKQRPKLAGILQLGHDSDQSGRIFYRESSSDAIPLSLFALGDHFPSSYNQLKSNGFPPDIFVHPTFSLDGSLRPGEPTVASRVRVSFISGGLILWLHLHHSLGDGGSLNMFLEDFGACTRGIPLNSPGIRAVPNLPLTSQDQDVQTLQELLAACPEYSILPNPMGPTSPELRPGGTAIGEIKKAGKIFVFQEKRLDELADVIRSEVGISIKASHYVCLAALTWVHTTIARLETEDFVLPSNRVQDAKLLTPFDWAWRCLGEKTESYTGNTVGTLLTQMQVSELIHAHDDAEGLSRVVQSLAMSLASVANPWLLHRNNLLARIEDPRLLGLNFDARQPQELGFNTWRSIGNRANWSIPGVPSHASDAIRRVQGEWNMAGANIMPARGHSDAWELLITIPECSMDALCKDHQWLKWVDEIIDEKGIRQAQSLTEVDSTLE